jgi:hypothetical protein
MKKLKLQNWLAALVVVLICTPTVFAQNRGSNPGDANPQELQELKELAPKVYLDCMMCDRDYIRDNITYVNFVRDRKDADVHILVTQQGTGSGGQEYTFAFIGLRDFKGTEHSLVHASNPTDSPDETRQSQVALLERGLFPFILETPICNYITLRFNQRLEPTDVKDPWNFWVFSINMDGRMSGQSTRTNRSLDTNLSANRETPEFKIRLGASLDMDERVYKYEDEDDYVSTSNQRNFSGMVVKSLGEHVSVGGWIEAEGSSYSNIDLLFRVAPAVEFNLFPYSESTRKQLRLLYTIGYNYTNYTEETIYLKTKETLWNQSLALIFEVRQPWGNASASVEGSHYFHDFKANRLEFNGSLSVRLLKGLSITVRGNYDSIRDQLNLPREEASLEEILLARKELETAFSYSLSLGVRYTFGSVYSNVVNPRFGRPRFRGGGGY